MAGPASLIYPGCRSGADQLPHMLGLRWQNTRPVGKSQVGVMSSTLVGSFIPPKHCSFLQQMGCLGMAVAYMSPCRVPECGHGTCVHEE